MTRTRRRAASLSVLLVLSGCSSPPAEPTLLTNEFAYRHPRDPQAVHSPDWIVTSGSLFQRGDALWSGVPDGDGPGPRSEVHTGSAVLRAVTSRADYRDVNVRFEVKVAEVIRTARTAARDHDGVHVMLRYRSEEAAYFVSVSRRDGVLAIKRKTPGGVSNGGTYRTLAETRPPPVPRLGSGWRHVDVTIRGATITLALDGTPVLRTDAAGPDPDTGRVGLRGDNCEFFVRGITIQPVRTFLGSDNA